MRELHEEGVIGELAADAYSFVGATSQLKLRERVAPLWADEHCAAQVDAVLLVPASVQGNPRAPLRLTILSTATGESRRPIRAASGRRPCPLPTGR